MTCAVKKEIPAWNAAALAEVVALDSTLPLVFKTFCRSWEDLAVANVVWSKPQDLENS